MSPAKRFKHVPSRAGVPPTKAEEEVFALAKRHLDGLTTWPRVLAVDDGAGAPRATVIIVETRDESGPCAGIIVEMATGAEDGG